MSEIKVNSIVDASGGSTVQVNGFTPTVSNMAGRNRIINGDMRIDQRNNGASATPVDSQYVLDRWKHYQSVASKYSVQQNAGGVTPPAGFTNYFGVVSLSSYTSSSGDYFSFEQTIEGYNVADLGWGTANAKTVTVSFWVRSSLTGTFGGSIKNKSSGADRSYPFSFVISAANTWEQKTITVIGDTTGTWLTTNGDGLTLSINLGTGTTYSGSVGAWASANYLSATGATSVVGTSGATFYVTGVQLEEGSVATPFEHRQYGQELALCQRYFQFVRALYETSLGTTGNIVSPVVTFSTPMRANPTITASLENVGSGATISSFSSNGSPETGYYSFYMALVISTAGYAYRYMRGTASAEL